MSFFCKLIKIILTTNALKTFFFFTNKNIYKNKKNIEIIFKRNLIKCSIITLCYFYKIHILLYLSWNLNFFNVFS